MSEDDSLGGRVAVRNERDVMHHYAKLLRRGAFFQKLGKVFNSKNYLFSFLRFTLTAPTNQITSNQKHSVIQSELVRELETQLIELNLSLSRCLEVGVGAISGHLLFPPSIT